METAWDLHRPPHSTFNLERMLGVPDGFAIEVADLRKIHRNVDIQEIC